jgi:hypothetical protein
MDDRQACVGVGFLKQIINVSLQHDTHCQILTINSIAFKASLIPAGEFIFPIAQIFPVTESPSPFSKNGGIKKRYAIS